MRTFIYTALYSFYDDKAGWVECAIKNIKQVRLYGKKIYSLIWMQYHNSNEKLKGTQIDRESWRGWNQNWDESAFEWVETKQFIKKIK